MKTVPAICYCQSQPVRREYQPHPAPITFEQVAYLARETLLRDGFHAPTLIIDGSNQPVLIQIDGMASSVEGRIRQMFVTGQALAHDGSTGWPRSVYFVTEAWLSHAQDGQLPDTPPSQDPQRKEVLLVSGLEARSRRSRLAVFEMVRDDQEILREIRELELPDDGSSDNPLLKAFLAGFWASDGLR